MLKKLVLTCATLLLALSAYGQMQSAVTGTVIKQYTYTRLDTYDLSGVAQTELFNGLNFTCPGTKTSGKQCYLDVTVYTELDSFRPQDSADVFMMEAYLDSTPAHVLYPQAAVGVDATSYGPVQQVRNTSWTSELLAPGPHVFLVTGYMAEPLGTVISRWSKLSATLYLYTGPAN